MTMEKPFLTQVFYCFVILLILNCFNVAVAADHDQECQWGAVDQSRYAEILTMISARVRENYERMTTWQGKVKIITDGMYEGKNSKEVYEQILREPVPLKVSDRREMTIEFALDSKKECLYQNYYSDGENYSTNAQTGQNLRFKELVQLGGSGKNILTPDEILTYMDSKNRDGLITGRIVIKQARPRDKQECSQLPPVFDPRETMRIFGDRTGKIADPLGGAFERYLAFFNKEEGRSINGYPTITVEECHKGDIKKYRINLLVLEKEKDGSTAYHFFKLICSSEAGYNVVSYKKTDNSNKVIEDQTWIYGSSDGVYLPIQKSKCRFDFQTGDSIERKNYTFTDQKINQPISDEVFTYTNLGLKNGDRVIDKIQNKKYIYQNEQLILVDEEHN